MATILRTPTSLVPPLVHSSTSLETPKRLCFPLNQRCIRPFRLSLSNRSFKSSFRFSKLTSFSATGETTETNEVEETEVQESLDDEAPTEDGASDGGVVNAEEKPASAIIASLQAYKEALSSNDESKVAEIEGFLLSLEDEKISLADKVATLSEELSVERARILRISADFDNFRKRTERDRLSLVTNAQGEVVESLLLVLDNFERAKAQIKVETPGEEKINNSYQSIYKQFTEILGSIGVVPVETVGIPFDPLLHEAIMREESAAFEEGIITEQFRKGFKLGDRLLRPSMVKVSAGPGPAKSEEAGPSENADNSSETNEGTSPEGEST
ncbi:protein GrpE-like [Macadamia integrifolia]|uniref:protein GrpE-like n=1 Tax=Macadamia integrifolia TaxID=60698 RepID=UPI001C4EC3F0|nr:protein GrpE-like [Macadamia integrifolia]